MRAPGRDDGINLCPPSAGRRRRPAWVLAAIMLAFVLAVSEIGSYLVVNHLAKRGAIVERWDPPKAFAGMTPSQLQPYYRDRFDPRFGWVGRPGTSFTYPTGTGRPWTSRIDAFGARLNPLFPDAPEMDVATYGDSYTYGEEVNDDETWQVAMSRRLGRYVGNFGVGAYGVDQAYLRYKLVPPPGAPPKLVILTIFSGDLSRSLTRWLGYYWSELWAAPLFKPRFELVDGALLVRPLPFDEPIMDPAVLQSMAWDMRHGDPWHARQVAMTWPWTARLAHVALVTLADRLEIDLPGVGINPGDAWASPSARAMLAAMLDEFIALARSRGSEPVLFFLDFLELSGSPSPHVASFVATLRRRVLASPVTVLTLGDRRFDRARLHWTRAGGHWAPEGNAAIADFLLEALSDRLAAPDDRRGVSS